MRKRISYKEYEEFNKEHEELVDAMRTEMAELRQSMNKNGFMVIALRKKVKMLEAKLRSINILSAAEEE